MRRETIKTNKCIIKCYTKHKFMTKYDNIKQLSISYQSPCLIEGCMLLYSVMCSHRSKLFSASESLTLPFWPETSSFQSRFLPSRFHVMASHFSHIGNFLKLYRILCLFLHCTINIIHIWCYLIGLFIGYLPGSFTFFFSNLLPTAKGMILPSNPQT